MNRKRSALVKILSQRLGPVPRDVAERIEECDDERKGDELIELACISADWNEFRARLAV